MEQHGIAALDGAEAFGGALLDFDHLPRRDARRHGAALNPHGNRGAGRGQYCLCGERECSECESKKGALRTWSWGTHDRNTCFAFFQHLPHAFKHIDSSDVERLT